MNNYTKITENSVNLQRKLSGLMDGGMLEFCTVDLDLLNMLHDKTLKNSEKNLKKSIYDIDNDNSSSIAFDPTLLSSYFPPKKSFHTPIENFSIEHIHDFCFPSGVYVDFVSEEEANDLTNTSGEKEMIFKNGYFFKLVIFFIICHTFTTLIHHSHSSLSPIICHSFTIRNSFTVCHPFFICRSLTTLIHHSHSSHSFSCPVSSQITTRSTLSSSRIARVSPPMHVSTEMLVIVSV